VERREEKKRTSLKGGEKGHTDRLCGRRDGEEIFAIRDRKETRKTVGGKKRGLRRWVRKYDVEKPSINLSGIGRKEAPPERAKISEK